jgi:hypothetical protein
MTRNTNLKFSTYTDSESLILHLEASLRITYSAPCRTLFLESDVEMQIIEALGCFSPRPRLIHAKAHQDTKYPRYRGPTVLPHGNHTSTSDATKSPLIIWSRQRQFYASPHFFLCKQSPIDSSRHHHHTSHPIAITFFCWPPCISTVPVQTS